MNLPIPPAVLYAGLAGVLLALIVATAQNKWQWRVFLLLALRLAIGWHFLFEGLHKIQSEYTGVTDTNRVFTSEPYFAVAEGPLGERLRKEYIGDPEKVYTDMLKQKEPMTAADFKKLSTEKQAELCPDAAIGDFKATVLANVQKAEADAKSAQETADKLPDGDEKEKRAKAEANELAAKKAEVAALKAKTLPEKIPTLQAAYARWVYGVDLRESKITYVTASDGALLFTPQERLRYIDLLRRESDEFTAREKSGLGNGNGIELTRKKKVQTDLLAAKSELAKDAVGFANELKKESGVEPTEETKPIKRIDWLTRWGITIIGAGLLLGLFTRVWCIAGAGFLVMTYLSHPTVPWLPLPPGTEGNPLFINKNLIEALALLALAAHPTGRWLGLDALVHRIVYPRAADPV